MRIQLSAFALAALLTGPVVAHGQQARPSQLGTVSQVIANARVDIKYWRPVARGRALFGDLVPWGQVWTPSADTAAIITLSTAMTVAGSRLNAGTYSLWAIPRPDSWTIMFTPGAPIFHMRRPSPGDEALRVQVTPTKGEHMETLGFYFPMVDGDSAVLNIHWGTVVVPIPLRVAR